MLSGRESIEVVRSPEGAPAYAAIVRLCGEHDLGSSEDIAATLALIDGDVQVDLTACDFIDASVVRVLVARSEELIRRGCRLDLRVIANTNVTRTLELVDLDRMLMLHVVDPPRRIWGVEAER
jgi:anti-anti-sigma factor